MKTQLWEPKLEAVQGRESKRLSRFSSVGEEKTKRGKPREQLKGGCGSWGSAELRLRPHG